MTTRREATLEASSTLARSKHYDGRTEDLREQTRLGAKLEGRVSRECFVPGGRSALSPAPRDTQFRTVPAHRLVVSTSFVPLPLGSSVKNNILSTIPCKTSKSAWRGSATDDWRIPKQHSRAMAVLALIPLSDTHLYQTPTTICELEENRPYSSISLDNKHSRSLGRAGCLECHFTWWRFSNVARLQLHPHTS